MASPTKQTEKRREIRRSKAGRDNKKKRAQGTTPKFPVHPEKASAEEK